MRVGPTFGSVRSIPTTTTAAVIWSRLHISTLSGRIGKVVASHAAVDVRVPLRLN